MKILRYTPELQKALGSKVKSEPWLHAMILQNGCWAIYVWDTREILDANVESNAKQEMPIYKFKGMKATDSYKPLTGKLAKDINFIYVLPIGWVQYHADGSAHTSGIKTVFDATDKVCICELNGDDTEQVMLWQWQTGMPKQGAALHDQNGKFLFDICNASVLTVGKAKEKRIACKAFSVKRY